MPINNFKQDEVLEENLNINIIKRLLLYLKPYGGPVTKTLLLMGFVIAVELFNPYFLKIAIDKFIKNGDWKSLVLLGGLMLVLNFVAMIFPRLYIIKPAYKVYYCCFSCTCRTY
jgi:ATP-binding cassette subfamily B multidrug efflux pump